MRKALALLACVAVVLGLAVAAAAAGGTEVTVTPDKTTVQPGDEVTFTVSISGNAGFSSFGYIPDPNSPVFEVLSGQVLAKDVLMGDFDQVYGGAVAFPSVKNHSGDIFSFTVKIREDAPLGEFSVTAAGGVAIKNANESVAFTLSEGKVTVVGEAGPTEPSDATAEPPQGNADEYALPWWIVAVPVILVLALAAAVILWKRKEN